MISSSHIEIRDYQYDDSDSIPEKYMVLDGNLVLISFCGNKNTINGRLFQLHRHPGDHLASNIALVAAVAFFVVPNR